MKIDPTGKTRRRASDRGKALCGKRLDNALLQTIGQVAVVTGPCEGHYRVLQVRRLTVGAAICESLLSQETHQSDPSQRPNMLRPFGRHSSIGQGKAVNFCSVRYGAHNFTSL